MFKIQKNNYFFLLWCSLLIPSITLFANEQDYTKQYRDLYTEVIQRDTSCIEELTSCMAYFESVGDTLWLTRSLIGLAQHESKDGNYGRAFAQLWQAQIYAEALNDYRLLYDVHSSLGGHYNIYNKREEAYEHQQQALKYAKIGVETGDLQGSALVSAYFSLVVYFTSMDKYTQALLYLDSCTYCAGIYSFTDDQKAYLQSQKGHILQKQGKTDEALAILKQAEANFKRINPGYLSIIYSYLGSAYAALEDWPNAEHCFRQSVATIEERHTHFDAKAESLGLLANSLSQQGRYAEAYAALEASKALNEEIFSTKGFQNQGLLDIRNMYEEEVEQRDRMILERDKALMTEKAASLRIRLLLIAVLAGFIILILFWYLRYNKRKFEFEKQSQEKISRMQQEQNKALVELKNKELTAFTLQLIDKDSLLTKLVGSVERYAPDNRPLLQSVKLETTGRLKLWEEFDKRFVSVNKDFYEKLKRRFPDLTRTEIKHCALIKLNFSAKEMAQLLNISINGVNTSRYRIRKKFGLDREDNLTRFIDGL